MKKYNIGLDMIVEANINQKEFLHKFVEWIESNKWECCGETYLVDENGDRIKNIAGGQYFISGKGIILRTNYGTITDS